MQEFFNWEMLATYAGAVIATTLITQLCKGVSFIDKIPTKVFSYVVAFIVMTVAITATGGFSWAALGLCAINAVVVSLASNGAFDALVQGKKE